MITLDLSSDEASAVLRALRMYVKEADDIGYRGLASHLATLVELRWQKERPGDEKLLEALRANR
jgi:hypothetical protein